jgi:hypothetical protein
MDEMTQQNAALVEQASAAAESMRDQAQALLQEVNQFKVGAAEYKSAPQTPRLAAVSASAPAARKPVAKAVAKPAAADRVVPKAAPRQALPPAAAKDEDSWEEF